MNGNQMVIGLHGHDLMWLHADGVNWTGTIFAAGKHEPNDAALMVTALKGTGVEAYSEPVLIAARRYQALTQPEGI